MGCNCKNAIKLAESNEKKEKKTILRKFIGFLKNVSFRILLVFIVLIVIPFVTLIIIFNILFLDKKGITISDKYIKKFLK